jgi:hypothetical protein
LSALIPDLLEALGGELVIDGSAPASATATATATATTETVKRERAA